MGVNHGGRHTAPSFIFGVIMQYGEYRSAREAARTSGKWDEAYAAACALEGDEREAALLDWWRCADLEKMSHDVTWGGTARPNTRVEDPIWWIDEKSWTIHLADHVLASGEELDIKPLALQWARVPLEAIAHIHKGWARAHTPEDIDLTHQVLAELRVGDVNNLLVMQQRLKDATNGVNELDEKAESQWRARLLAMKVLDSAHELIGAHIDMSKAQDKKREESAILHEMWALQTGEIWTPKFGRERERKLTELRSMIWALEKDAARAAARSIWCATKAIELAVEYKDQGDSLSLRHIMLDDILRTIPGGRWGKRWTLTVLEEIKRRML